MFSFVRGNMICTIVEGGIYTNEILAGQRKMDDEHKCFMKTGHVNQLTEPVAECKEVNWQNLMQKEKFSWNECLKGLFRMKLWVSAEMLQKKKQRGNSWTRAHEEF